MFILKEIYIYIKKYIYASIVTEALSQIIIMKNLVQKLLETELICPVFGDKYK